MFAPISSAATARFNEVRLLLNEVKARELPAPQMDPDIVSLMRGLFFVHLYGAFEFSISQAAQTLLQGVSALNVKYAHLEHLFHVVALDAKFTSLEMKGSRAKWSARRDLLTEQLSGVGCTLNDTVFQRDLQNVWFETLENLFAIFCVNEPILPDVRYRGYIDEVVNTRNAISHGRESPITVGRTRSPDLEKRFEAITKTATHVIICFEKHYVARAFVSSAHRAGY